MKKLYCSSLISLIEIWFWEYEYDLIDSWQKIIWIKNKRNKRKYGLIRLRSHMSGIYRSDSRCTFIRTVFETLLYERDISRHPVNPKHWQCERGLINALFQNLVICTCRQNHALLMWRMFVKWNASYISFTEKAITECIFGKKYAVLTCLLVILWHAKIWS